VGLIVGRRSASGQASSVVDRSGRSLRHPLQEATITARTALVVGGASGIGRASAERLARDGAQVVITGRRLVALAAAAVEIGERTGTTVGYLVSDIADPGAASTTVADVESRYGTVDIAVLSAGGPPPGRVLEVTDEQWHTAYELLVLGPMRLARRVLPGMAERGFGRVILVTSTAVRQPQPDLAASVVLRAAATSAAKLMSRELATRGVTVNCVAPGATDTDRRRQILTSRAAASDRTYDELDAADRAGIPAGRPGEPAEIAVAVAFLASDAAGYVNGTVLTVDGGRTETI
jgi:3-oxoacyl-[acyl-carrier protein] reductase